MNRKVDAELEVMNEVVVVSLQAYVSSGVKLTTFLLITLSQPDFCGLSRQLRDRKI